MTPLAFTFTLSALAFRATALALPTQQQCVSLQIPIKVSTTATKRLQPRVDSNIDAQNWILNMTTWSSPRPPEHAIGKIDINQTFQLGGQLGVPKYTDARLNIL